MAKYTEASSDDLEKLIAEWGFATESVSAIDGGAANSSYYFTDTDGNRYVLSILDNHDVKTADTLCSLLQYLVERGVPTSLPLPSANGRTVRFFRERPTIVKPFIEGRVPSFLSTDEISSLGAVLNDLHSIEPVTDLGLTSRRMPPDWEKVASSFDRTFHSWLVELHERTEPTISKLAQTSLIHGDLFPDNLVIADDGQISIIDWETAAIDSPLLDLGFAVVGLCCQKDDIDNERVDALAEGYGDLSDRHVLTDATLYAILILAYHRYLRHKVRFPDPARSDEYLELVSLGDRIKKRR